MAVRRNNDIALKQKTSYCSLLQCLDLDITLTYQLQTYSNSSDIQQTVTMYRHTYTVTLNSHRCQNDEMLHVDLVTLRVVLTDQSDCSKTTTCVAATIVDHLVSTRKLMYLYEQTLYFLRVKLVISTRRYEIGSHWLQRHTWLLLSSMANHA